MGSEPALSPTAKSPGALTPVQPTPDADDPFPPVPLCICPGQPLMLRFAHTFTHTMQDKAYGTGEMPFPGLYLHPEEEPVVSTNTSYKKRW